MPDKVIDACVTVDISDDDVYEAMKDISGYLDITPGDFKEVYLRAFQHAVGRLTRSLKAKDVMTRDVILVRPSTSLAEVAEILSAKGISGVPVVEEDGKVVGILSEKDFLSAMSRGKSTNIMEIISICVKERDCLAAPMRAKTAADIMSSPAVVVQPDTAVMDVAELFTQKGINRVPVVDDTGKLRGIIARADIVRSSFGWEKR